MFPLLHPRPALKDIQVPAQNETLEALRKVSHCHHSNSFSRFRPALLWKKGGNPRKDVNDILRI